VNGQVGRKGSFELVATLSIGELPKKQVLLYSKIGHKGKFPDPVTLLVALRELLETGKVKTEILSTDDFDCTIQ
jgi:hypothetical protein